MNVKAIAVAALVSLAMPAAVLAQAENPAPDANAASSASGDAMGLSTDFNTFMQGMAGADYTSASSAIDSATTFNVVKLSSVPDADAAQLNTAIQPHQSDIASLATKIDANAQAKAALEAQGLSASNVVWVETGADGAVTLYVNDLGSSQ